MKYAYFNHEFNHNLYRFPLDKNGKFVQRSRQDGDVFRGVGSLLPPKDEWDGPAGMEGNSPRWTRISRDEARKRFPKAFSQVVLDKARLQAVLDATSQDQQRQLNHVRTGA